MSLDSNALITAEYYYNYIGKSVENENLNIKQTEILINVASQLAEDFCNRKFITPDSAVLEYFNGDNSSIYYTDNKPIVTATKLEYWSGSLWTEYSSTSYPTSFDSSSNKLWFTKGHVFFESSYENNWRITYTYGYTIENIPKNLKGAIVQLVQRLIMKASGKEGLESENFGDSSTNYNLSDLPSDVERVLKIYRRVIVG